MLVDATFIIMAAYFGWVSYFITLPKKDNFLIDYNNYLRKSYLLYEKVKILFSGEYINFHLAVFHLFTNSSDLDSSITSYYKDPNF